MSSNQTPAAQKPVTKKIGILLRHSPYGNNLTLEVLDAVLTSAAYDQSLSLIFMGDGIFQLLKEQSPQAIEHKSIEKKLASFAIYDIDQVYVCAYSLQQRQLTAASLSIAVTILEEHELSELIHQQETLLSF